jgi:adenosylmethionine-8-amino-7-oxononanoate aminotransferase
MPACSHVRQRGMIWACDACIDDAATAAAASSRAGWREAARRELLVRPIGTALYVMPPYIIDAQQAQWLGERLHAAFDAALSGKEKA